MEGKVQSEDVSIKLLKKLIQLSNTDSTLWNTMNLLLIVANIREAYYEDSDEVSLTDLPDEYRKTFIRVCEMFELGMLFHVGRYFVFNPTTRIPHKPVSEWSVKEMGKILGLRCSPNNLKRPLKEIFEVSLEIETEKGKVIPIKVYCQTGKRMRKWYESIKERLDAIGSLFRVFKHDLTFVRPRVAPRVTKKN
jgi:hypothetical protein